MQLEQIVDHVEQKLFGSLESEVSSKVIGELVMEQLRKVDEDRRMCGLLRSTASLRTSTPLWKS